MARWSDQARAAIARIHAAMPDGAARGLAEKKARPAMMSCRDSGWNAHGRFALFRCPRCKTEKIIQIESDNDKLAKPPCPNCNKAQR